jgi:hypothetical protein
MSAVDVGKLKPGDKVLVCSPHRLGGSSTGWYIALRVGTSAAAVIRAETLDLSQCVKVYDGDIVEVLRPLFVDVNLLPTAPVWDLDAPLQLGVQATAPAEELPPQKRVRVRIVNPQAEYQLPHQDPVQRGRMTINTHFLKEAVERGVDQHGQPWADFVWEERDAVDLQRNLGEHAVQIIENPVGTPVDKAGR